MLGKVLIIKAASLLKLTITLLPNLGCHLVPEEGYMPVTG